MVPHTRTLRFSPPLLGCWIGTLDIRRTRAPWCGWNGNWGMATSFNMSVLPRFKFLTQLTITKCLKGPILRQIHVIIIIEQ